MDLIGLAERIYYTLRPRGDVIERLRRSLPKGRALRTLDFGGGEGRVSRALSEAWPGIFVIADVDLEALRRVPAGGSLHPVLVPAGGRLPFHARAFDCILVVDVLHEVGDGRERLLAELARALRPEGELFVIDFDGRNRLTLVFRWLARAARRRCRFFQTPEELRDALFRTGLEAEVESVDGLRFIARGRAVAALASQPGGSASGADTSG